MTSAAPDTAAPPLVPRQRGLLCPSVLFLTQDEKPAVGALLTRSALASGGGKYGSFSWRFQTRPCSCMIWAICSKGGFGFSSE